MGIATVDHAAPKADSALSTASASATTPRTSQRKRLGRAEGLGRLRMVVGNTAISLVGQCITWTSTLALTMAYGRFLGPSGFGELYLAVTLVGLIGFPLEFGFNQQIIREVAQAPERAHRFLTSALILKVSLWAPLWGLLLLATWLLRYSLEERELVMLCGVTLLATSIGAAFGSMHIAVHRNVTPVFGTILEKTFDAIVAFALLRFWHVGVIPVAYVLLVGATVSAIWQAAWFFRLEHPELALDLPLMREIVRTSIPFLVYGVLGVIYYRVDTVMLGAMDGDTVVGWYGAGYRIFDTLIFLPSLVMSTVMYPLMARLSKHEPQALKLAVEKSTNFLLIIGMPLTVGLASAAPAIVGFLYHHTEFSHTVFVIRALAPGLILLYMNSVISSIIVSVKRERLMIWMAGAALVLNVPLNFLLIPRYHEVAAAGVTSFTELALLIMGLCMIPRELIPLGSLPTLAKSLLASAAMAGVVLALSSFSIPVILPAAGLAYLAVGAVVRLIPRDDLRALVMSVRSKSAQRIAQAPAASADAPAERELAVGMSPSLRLADVTGAWTSSNALLTTTSAVTRARLVTRARSTSGPLTAAQRATVLAAAQRAGALATQPVAPRRNAQRQSGQGAQPRASSSARTRRVKGNQPRHATRGNAAVV